MNKNNDDQSLNIEEIHKVSLDILKKLIDICEVLNINYYLAYGSLIGAVRHQGFIPWDDDLDIILLRDEYEKFIDYCIKNAESIRPFEILSRKNISDYPYPIARLSDSRYVARFCNLKSFNCGAFIDIYPLDGFSNIRDTKRIQCLKKIWMKFAVYASLENIVPSPNCFFKNEIKKMVYIYANKKGKDYFLDKLEELGKRYSVSESEYVASIVWNNQIAVMPKKYFSDTRLLNFESIKVKVPVAYDKILRILYGDYMKLPPENERIPQHNYFLYKK